MPAGRPSKYNSRLIRKHFDIPEELVTELENSKVMASANEIVIDALAQYLGKPGIEAYSQEREQLKARIAELENKTTPTNGTPSEQNIAKWRAEWKTRKCQESPRETCSTPGNVAGHLSRPDPESSSLDGTEAGSHLHTTIQGGAEQAKGVEDGFGKVNSVPLGTASKGISPLSYSRQTGEV